MGEMHIFGQKTEENRPFGRHRLRLEDNIKMDHREIGYLLLY
jgi:hypothetical protein